MTSSARAIIDLDVTGHTINRHIYGHFAEHLGRCIYDGFWVGEDSPIPNERGIRLDIVEALRALDIPNLRWPGGCFADTYHWRDGIGPREDRPQIANTNWGDVVENNHFGTHEFMDLCDMLGADAYVNGNVGSGTVQEMSEWVEYLTRGDDSPMARLRRQNGRDEPWRVPFWGIGNEAWGCGGNMSAEYYAEEARRYATFCHNHGDNRLTRIAAGAHEDDLDWTRVLMKTLTECHGCTLYGNLPYQAVSFHYYTHSGSGINTEDALPFSDDQYYRTMAYAADMDRVIRGHIAVMDSYDPTGRVGLVCDEWGTWWNVEEGTNPGFLFQQNTVRDALVAGIHFDIFHRYERLTMANIAQTVNVLQAMVLTDGDRMVLTPTYHVFEMNKGHQDARRLVSHLVEAPSTTVEGTPLDLVSLSASTKDDSALISVSHLSADADCTVTVDLRGRRADVRRARVLTGGSAADFNDVDAPDRVSPQPLEARVEDGILTVVVPPHSFSTIELDLV
ncbi:alpha-N-arabinofuranosidase [Microbacterium ginsengiterrae]|uniref:non-reducing end alpha-L-arabinofuranosidase n=1 Tax=Microbacterium ginsengiterrae TaxID=546115 RepID=A0A7W9CB84_9MICO|nr:alpha-L-arabinofuranosidase C-terminal domain-containing protein [Microbacterium ginsengiterrae]MBB5742418.1 alpha-N-arabinofuranosidase [Microbacterium ginsengiterrae]